MASMKEVDLLMETCLRQGAEPDFLPGLIVEFLPPDRVDAYMAGLSADLREVAINYIQEMFASGQEGLRLGDAPQSFMDREAALRAWVVRSGRYHHPRASSEPEMTEVFDRLACFAPRPSRVDAARLVKRPWALIKWVPEDRLEDTLRECPEDAAKAVEAWAGGVFPRHARHYVDVSQVPDSTREVLLRWIRRRGVEGAGVTRRFGPAEAYDLYVVDPVIRYDAATGLPFDRSLLGRRGAVRVALSLDVARQILVQLGGLGGAVYLVPVAYRSPRLTLDDARAVAQRWCDERAASRAELGDVDAGSDGVLWWVFHAPDREAMAQERIPGHIEVAVDKCDGHVRTDEEYRAWQLLNSLSP